MTIASPRQGGEPVEGAPVLVTRFWAWLTRCAADGCDERPVHLGWCAAHAPAYEPAPDEYWGELERDSR